MFRPTWVRLIKSTKGKRCVTQLGGPDELACDFERRGLCDDAGAGI
jgi:hypothetical protein